MSYLLAACLMAVCSHAQKKKVAYTDGLYAEVNTSRGLIVIRLEFEKTPMTVSNFVGLAEGSIHNEALPPGKPYYDGSPWHRVVPGHVIQAGKPARSAAIGPGYQYPNEIAPDLSHAQAGAVGMANSGPHTNGSQWYITLGDRSYLDGDYTVFGHVVRGLEILPLITQDDSIKTVRILRAGGAAQAFRPTTASFNAMVEAKKAAVVVADQKRREDEERFIRQSWPDAQPFMRQAIVRPGDGARPKPGDRLTVSYRAQVPGGESFVSTADEGKPANGDVPASFVFIVGTSSINPGFDAGVAQMRKGEKRVLILPAEQAYGPGGYYAPERKGEKRFHVGPNRTIVYEVEVTEINR
jgi:cyclophilin family peptidyl-prolyl cis-trans isomerase